MIEFECEGLYATSGTVQLNLQNEEKITSNCRIPFTIKDGDMINRIPLPADIKKYYFLLDFSIQFEGLVPGIEGKIRNISFIREKQQ